MDLTLVVELVIIGLTFFMLINASALLVLAERKIMGFMQQRYGPYLVGPHGALQPLADIVKLLFKEEFIPANANKVIFHIAPILAVFPAIVTFSVIPMGPPPMFVVTDINVGLLLFMAMSSLGVYAITLGGWASNNKYALLSTMRAVNQIISYDLPFIFSALVPVMLAGSLKMSDIALAQKGFNWFIFYPVIGQLAFIMFVVATLAAENRVPFDILEAESELVAGFRVEYSGMKFAIIQLGEYAHIIGSSFLGALLFMGAWAGPGPEALGPVWFLLKAVFLFLLLTLVRWSFVRIRVDQILALSWKGLLPTSLVLLITTAIVVVWRTGV